MDKQIRLLKPMLEYCDVRILDIGCGTIAEAEAVGSAVVEDLEGRLRFQVFRYPHATLRIEFVPPDERSAST